MTHELKPLVSKVLEGGDPSNLLTALIKMHRDDLFGQSAIRLLMKRDLWDFTPGGEHDMALEHLFGAYEERVSPSSDEYVKQTHDIVLNLWGISLEPPQWHVPATTKAKKDKRVDTVAETLAKKSRKKSTTPVPVDGPVDATRYGTLTSHDVDTSQASDRLKKVIKIQRGG